MNVQTDNTYPMRVVLSEKNNSMSEMWLPAKKEGRYIFKENGKNLPISIIAENDEWQVVVTEKKASENNKKSMPLLECDIVPITVNGRVFQLYFEKSNINDYVFIHYHFNKHDDIRIGRSSDCDIFYDNNYVSRHHATLKWENDSWYIVDQDSKNGVFLNGKSVSRAKLSLGDTVCIMGLYIIMGVDFIAMNNANARVRVNSKSLVKADEDTPINYSPTRHIDYDLLFERKPRKKYFLEEKEFELELPPQSMEGSKIKTLLRLGNPMVMGTRSIMMGNPMMALTSTLFPLLTQGFTEKEIREYEKLRKEKYHEYLLNFQRKISAEINLEKETFNKMYPPLAEILRFSEGRGRLWERRKLDEDFLNIRLGEGQLPMVAQLKYPVKGFTVEEDELENEMYELAEVPYVIDHAPVMLSLKDRYISSVTGDRKKVIKLVKNIIAQTVIAHSYDELKLVILSDSNDAEHFEFTKYLPHCWDNDRSVRLYAEKAEDTQQISKFLSKELDSFLNNEERSVSELTLRKKCSYLVIATSKDLFERVSVLQDIMSADQYLNVSILTAFKNPPKETFNLITVDNENILIDLKESSVKDRFFEFDPVDRESFDVSMRNISKIRLALEEEKSELPKMITFLEMYGVGKVEYLNPFQRWKENNPIKSLAAPLGIGTDGGLFTLDLHEKKQGPHGLIAGGTGSGKSEFIISYILSMAVGFSPDEVAFVLIDYKGGGLADAFVDKKRGIYLPHVVATITNLDGSAIQRSLLSIQSELKRRQEVFKKAKSEVGEGTLDIYDYQKLYREGVVAEPLPHLFIIADEFAELKKQEPEFMDELISIARIGRSLGVHLILATQKPNGVVNEQIWSNTKFRICLRVATPADSVEMLRRPDASEIKNTGRFYMQVGANEMFAMGQSAWCGADYFPSEEIVQELDQTIQFINNSGQVVIEANPKQNTVVKSSGKQITSIVRYLSDIAKRENIVPKSLWCEPLADRIELGNLIFTEKESGSVISAVLGMVDDPEHQIQFPYVMDIASFHHLLVCGQSGSGKSNFIKSLLLSLMSNYSPEELSYYIVDFSGGALREFSKARHCGLYITEENESEFDRFFAFIKEMVGERKKLFTQAEVSNFDDYRKKHSLPAALVIIDNYVVMQSLKNGINYHNDISTYMKECASYGIKFILTANYLNEVHSRTRQEMDCRFALMGKDRYDYSDILDRRCLISTPRKPGRGVAVVNERNLEIHIGMIDADLDEEDRVAKLKERIADINKKYQSSQPVKALAIYEPGETYEEFLNYFSRERIPLGYYLRDMKRVAMPLQQFFRMSLYFGGSAGVQPIVENLFSAFLREDGEIIVVKRNTDSIFDIDHYKEELNNMNISYSIFDTSFEGLSSLKDRIMSEIVARNVYRDQYCEEHNIPSSNPKRVLKAAEYIRHNTKPIFIFFESIGEICGLDKTDELKDVLETFDVFFDKMKGYNVYFIGTFYPEDVSVNEIGPFIKSFIANPFALFFGGRYDKQNIVNSMPMEVRRINKVVREYDSFVMYYKEEWYSMRMPCGEIKEGEPENPDEVSII